MTRTETDSDILASLDFAPRCAPEPPLRCAREAVGIASVDCPGCGDRQDVPLCGAHYRHLVKVMVTYKPGFECFRCATAVDLEHIIWRAL